MSIHIWPSREFDEEAALQDILDVFWAKGFEGTSLSYLVARTGLQKGSLYAAFGDKRAMYRTALALYDRTVIDGAASMLATIDASEQGLDMFLQSALDSAAKQSDRRGCFFAMPPSTRPLPILKRSERSKRALPA